MHFCTDSYWADFFPSTPTTTTADRRLKNKIILFDAYMIVSRRRTGLDQFSPSILGLVHLRCGRGGHWPPGSGTDSACSHSGNHGWIVYYFALVTIGARAGKESGEKLKRRVRVVAGPPSEIARLGINCPSTSSTMPAIRHPSTERNGDFKMNGRNESVLPDWSLHLLAGYQPKALIHSWREGKRRTLQL